MRRVALVLAAGAGRRFGGDKLSAEFRGMPLVHHAIRAARAAPVDRVIVVCGAGLAIGEWPGEPRVEAVRVASAALSEIAARRDRGSRRRRRRLRLPR